MVKSWTTGSPRRSGNSLHLFGRVIADDRIATTPLRRIEAGIGPLDHRVGAVAGAVAGNACGDRDAAESLACRALDEILRHDRHPQLLRDDTGFAEARPREDDGELLAAIAGREVSALDVELERLCHQPQDLVAGQVAESVVEALEVIDV